MQKIIPHLWFDAQAEDAANFYTPLFENSQILNTAYYPKATEEVSGKKAGTVMTVVFELAGFKIMALNGGPQFKLTPATSFSVHCETETQINNLWAKLVDGGSVLMEFTKYPFSDKYGWLVDKYGVSWQLNLTRQPQKIIPSLLFVKEMAGKAYEAMKLYTSIFNNSEIVTVSEYTKGEGDIPGYIKYALFKLANQEFIAMDSSAEHKFNFTEAFSLLVNCQDQAEIDKYWQRLTEDGGQESMCGWLKDKYGLSWQIVPEELGKMFGNPDPERVEKVTKAMLEMKKLDLAALQAASKS